MKKYFIFTAVLIVSVGLSATAHADEDGTVIANIPFDFIIAGKIMPAGMYIVGRESSGVELLVSSRDTGVFVIPIPVDSSEHQKPVLIFNKVADSYFLRQVNTPRGAFMIDTHREVNKSGAVETAWRNDLFGRQLSRAGWELLEIQVLGKPDSCSLVNLRQAAQIVSATLDLAEWPADRNGGLTAQFCCTRLPLAT